MAYISASHARFDQASYDGTLVGLLPLNTDAHSGICAIAVWQQHRALSSISACVHLFVSPSGFILHRAREARPAYASHVRSRLVAVLRFCITRSWQASFCMRADPPEQPTWLVVVLAMRSFAIVWRVARPGRRDPLQQRRACGAGSAVAVGQPRGRRRRLLRGGPRHAWTSARWAGARYIR